MLQLPVFLTNMKTLILIASLLAAGGITAASGVMSQDNAGIFSSNEDGFQKVIQADAQDIENAVNNVLAGRENPEEVKKLILTEYKGTQRDSTYSAEEIEINTAYQAFLNEAYTVVDAYGKGQTPDTAVMKAAKANI